MKIQLIIPVFLMSFSGILFLSSCGAGKYPALSEAECMGAGLEGSIRVKAWGYAATSKEAIEQAKRNAIQDVLFKGIKAGNQGCPSTPIVKEGPEKKPAYFSDFFRDNGPYLRYVSISGDGTILPEDRVRVGRKYKIGVFVVVDHLRLKQKMQEDGLAPKLTDGF